LIYPFSIVSVFGLFSVLLYPVPQYYGAQQL